MTHVEDELELLALGALPADVAARVNAHLVGCAACRVEADALRELVSALPEALEPRELPPGLRDRILASARAETAARRTPHRTWPALGLRSRLVLAGLAAAVLVLAAVDLRTARDLRAAQDEQARMTAVVERLGQSGRSWYMAGSDQWKGSGGTFAVSAAGNAVVLFHDLKPLADDTTYAFWLVSPDGRWLRGANVRPDGRKLQLVELAARADGYDRCVVTLEARAEGRREGPVVMESRILETY